MDARCWRWEEPLYRNILGFLFGQLLRRRVSGWRALQGPRH